MCTGNLAVVLPVMIMRWGGKGSKLNVEQRCVKMPRTDRGS